MANRMYINELDLSCSGTDYARRRANTIIKGHVFEFRLSNGLVVFSDQPFRHQEVEECSLAEGGLNGDQ